jgi:Vacuolar sorting protein 39 domain 1
MRLQPVPVDSQVREMLRKGQVIAAQDLLVTTAPNASVLQQKLNRLRIDAARVLMFNLDFEAAFEQLSLSSVDPREVLSLFPELQISLAGTSAAAQQDPPLGSVPTELIRSAYRYQCRYFHPALCNGIVDGSKIPADAASEAADASSFSSSGSTSSAVMIGGAGSSSGDDGTAGFLLSHSDSSGSLSSKGSGASSGSGSGAGMTTTYLPNGLPIQSGPRPEGLQPGVRSACADISTIISARLPAYIQRFREEEQARAELSPHSPPPKRPTPTAEDRLTACYEGLLNFLRKRRAALLKAVRGDSEEQQQAPSTSSSSSSSASSGPPSQARRGSFAAPDNAVSSGVPSSGSGSSGSSASSSSSSGGRVDPEEAERIVNSSFYSPNLTNSSFSDASNSNTDNSLRLLLGNSPLSDLDIDALFLALDTALLKLFYYTKRWRSMDFFAFKCPCVDLPDATAFLRAVGKYHTSALLYQGRGMVREALETWKELGTSAVLEYREKVAVKRSETPHHLPHRRQLQSVPEALVAGVALA